MTLFCNMLAPIIAHLNNSTKELQQLQYPRRQTNILKMKTFLTQKRFKHISIHKLSF